MKTKSDVFKKKEERTIEEYKQLLGNFDNQIYRLTSIVNSLLTITQIGKKEDFKKINLQSVVKDILKETKLMYPTIKTSAKIDNNISIYGNQQLIYQALFNVIENSFKYNFSDGSVTIQLNQRDGNTTIKISDNGLGISDKDKLLVFNPFYRVDKSRNRDFGGSGLGLTLTKYVIDNHMGTIHIEDNTPCGSIFIINFKEISL